jgi:hypothetical protein
VRTIRAFVVLEEYEGAVVDGNQHLVLEAVVHAVPEIVIIQFLYYLVKMSV